MEIPANYDEILDMAKLSCLVYSGVDKGIAKFGLGVAFSGLPTGYLKQDYNTSNYKRIRKFDPKQWESLPCNPLDVALYEGITDASKDIWVLAIRGTEPTSIWDIRDFMVMNKGFSTQMKELMNIVIPLKKEADASNKTLMFTGHSQGGGLADLAALVTECRAITFNAGGISPTVTRDVGGLTAAQVAEREGNLIHVNVKGDWISDPWHNAPRTGGMTRLDFPYEGVPIPFFPAPLCLDGPAIQYGSTFIWLEGIDANFLYAFPDWLSYAKFCKAVLNHSWDTFHYQLVHKKFLVTSSTKPSSSLLYRSFSALLRVVCAVIRVILSFWICIATFIVRILVFMAGVVWLVKQYLQGWYNYLL